MPNLEITLRRGRKLSNVSLAVEVVGSDLETKWKGAIALGHSAIIENLEADLYSVQASLPSGQKLTHVCDLKSGSKKVEIDVTSVSPRESLEWAVISKPIALASHKQQEAQLPPVWLRLWARDRSNKWSVRPWPTQTALREGALVQYEFNFRSSGEFGQYFLQVGGPTMQWRLISLPSDDICVLITGDETVAKRDLADSAVNISVATMNAEAEVLLDYLSLGQIDQARIVSKAIIAEELLLGKRSNPITAAIAGYFLLGTQNLERLNQVWTSNLADWMPWLPDGAVIDAWRQMRLEEPDLLRARQRLIEAAARGMPVYTRGLRLLLDGLALFDDDEEHGGPDVRAALKCVRKYAAAADWRSATTTFIGRDPDSPGKTQMGKPDNPTYVVFLADVDEEDLEWKRGLKRRLRASQAGATTESIPQDQQAPVSSLEEVNVTQARRAALGETEEVPGFAGPLTTEQQLPAFFSQVAQDRYLAGEVNREEQLTKNKLLSQHNLGSSRRGVARLLRVAAAQTQTERSSDASPVALYPESEHPTYLQGIAIERILGLSGFLSVSFLERGLSAARTVGRVAIGRPGGGILGYATGCLVSPRLFLTNRHVIGSAETARSSVVEFNYQDGINGDLLPTTSLAFDPETFFITSPELDISVIALSNPQTVTSFGWNYMTEDQGKVVVGEHISLIQHTDGAPKQVSIRDNQVVDILKDFVHYQSDIAPPSSGAPLYNDQWELIAIHHASVPMRDAEGHTLKRDGTYWTPEMGAHQIQWVAHEGVRVSRIVSFLKVQKLPDSQTELRDELLFRKPSLSF